MLVTEGRDRALPLISRAARVLAEEKITIAESLRWALPAAMAAIMTWDEESWDKILTRQQQACREAGWLAPLLITMNGLAVLTD